MDNLVEKDFVKQIAKEIFDNNEEYKNYFSINEINEILDLSKNYQNTNEESVITRITDSIEAKIVTAVSNRLESEDIKDGNN